MPFNKEQFANFLNKAKGIRSINRFGIESDVDPGYISRLLRQLVESPPSATVIQKLAKNSHNEVTISDLMSSAGYLTDDINIKTNNVDTNKLPILEKIFFDGFLEASQEEKEEIIRYWHEEIRKKNKNTPNHRDNTPSAWDLKDK